MIWIIRLSFFLFFVDLTVSVVTEYEEIITHPASEKNTRQTDTNPLPSWGCTMPPLPLLLCSSHMQVEVSSCTSVSASACDSWIQYLHKVLKIAWTAVIVLHWACFDQHQVWNFVTRLITSLCHRNEQHSNWKCFLESRDVVSAANFPLSIPRVRGWKCYPMEQQGLLNTWWAGSPEGKSVSITFYFKTPKPFAVQCCTFWLCHRIAATISRSVGLQHCPWAVFSQGSIQLTRQTHHSE